MLFSHLYRAVLLTAISVAPCFAVFETPNNNSNSWGGWTRGEANTIYVGWDDFADETSILVDTVIVDRSPDFVMGSFNSGELIETTGSGFITTSDNIYSFTGIVDFEVDVDGNGPSGPTQVVLQARTFGNELSPATVRLNSRIPDEIFRFFIGTLGGTFGGEEVEYLYIWNLDSEPSSYSFDFAAQTLSMSLAAIDIDIGPIPTIEPEPEPEIVSVPFPKPALFIGFIAILLVSLLAGSKSKLRS